MTTEIRCLECGRKMETTITRTEITAVEIDYTSISAPAMIFWICVICAVTQKPSVYVVKDGQVSHAEPDEAQSILDMFLEKTTELIKKLGPGGIAELLAKYPTKPKKDTHHE